MAKVEKKKYVSRNFKLLVFQAGGGVGWQCVATMCVAAAMLGGYDAAAMCDAASMWAGCVVGCDVQWNGDSGSSVESSMCLLRRCEPAVM
jgi:hypothetical protein